MFGYRKLDDQCPMTLIHIVIVVDGPYNLNVNSLMKKSNKNYNN